MSPSQKGSAGCPRPHHHLTYIRRHKFRQHRTDRWCPGPLSSSSSRSSSVLRRCDAEVVCAHKASRAFPASATGSKNGIRDNVAFVGFEVPSPRVSPAGSEAREHPAMEVKDAAAISWSLVPASRTTTATHFGSHYHLYRRSYGLHEVRWLWAREGGRRSMERFNSRRESNSEGTGDDG